MSRLNQIEMTDHPLLERKTRAIVYGLSFVACMASTLIIYFKSFGFAWTYDDYAVILGNPDILSFQAFLEDTLQGRPLRELSYLLDYQLFGLNPSGWHIQSLVWHGLCAWLWFLFVYRIDRRVLTAAAATIVFLAHPIVVEVVANVGHRKESLALAFGLAAFHAWLSFSRSKYKQWAWLLTAVLFWFIALSAKLNLLVLPAVIGCYELVFARDQHTVKIKRRIGYFLGCSLVGVAGFVGYIIKYKVGSFLAVAQGMFNKMNYFEDVSLSMYYPMVLKSWAFMAGKIVWPFDLAVEYTFPIPASWLDFYVAGSLVMVFVVLYGFSWSYKRHRLMFLGLSLLTLFWLPTSNIWPLAYFAADRYLYAPLMGFSLLFALAICRLLQPVNVKAQTATLMLILMALGYLSFQQSLVWQDHKSLWTQSVKVSPDGAWALVNLGNIALEEGDKDSALNYYRQSYKNNPYNPSVNYNLGFLYFMAGESQLARKHLQDFLKFADPKKFPKERSNVERQLQLLP